MPGTQAELQATYEQAVNRAILDKRRHQYLQEYPGGPIDRYAFAGIFHEILRFFDEIS